LNVHGINDVRQREIHAAEPLVFDPSSFEAEITIEKLKGINHHELIQAGGKTLCSNIHRFISSVWTEEEFSSTVEGVYFYTYLYSKKRCDKIDLRHIIFTNFIHSFIHHFSRKVNIKSAIYTTTTIAFGVITG
jgi:hypothetical protein